MGQKTVKMARRKSKKSIESGHASAFCHNPSDKCSYILGFTLKSKAKKLFSRALLWAKSSQIFPSVIRAMAAMITRRRLGGGKNTFSTTYDFPLLPPLLLAAAALLPPRAKEGDEENFPPSLFGKSSNFAPFLFLLLQSNLPP